MKTQQTSAEAKDLIDEIAEAMELARLGEIDQQTPDSDRLSHIMICLTRNLFPQMPVIRTF
jgi:hypothetical protein